MQTSSDTCINYIVYVYSLNESMIRGAFKGGEGGPSPPLESKFHFFLQSCYEIIKGVQHVYMYFK